MIVIGSGPFAQALVRELEGTSTATSSTIVGFLDDRMLRPLSAVVGCSALAHVSQQLGAGRIVLALPEGRNPLVERRLPQLCGMATTVENGIDAYARLTGKIPIEQPAAVGMMFSKKPRRSFVARAGKRAFDLAAAVTGLFVLFPLFALIAAAIKLDSKDPVFFVQERIGRFGRPFRMIKFRTMHAAQSTSEWVRDNSFRITRVGRWLRHFRLDEIPQLLNVLCGDMSLIGPRPHPSSNQPIFTQQIPFYSTRTRLRPGITGWAQVKYGYANDLDEETEKVRYDLYYVQHASFRLDVRILFETVKTVLLGRCVESVATAKPLATGSPRIPMPRYLREARESRP